MNIAVILAGGVGNRLGYEFPKQFFKVAGKSVIEHTIDIFENNPLIDEIAVVVHTVYISNIEAMVLNNGWKKVRKILKGGAERYESSLVAINAYQDDINHNLIFHDAVRPMLSQKVLNHVIEALKKYNAVNVAIPATDTIIKVNETGELIESVPNREYLMRGQTPQAFKLHTIKKAYEIAQQDLEFSSSDDCGIVVKYLPNEKVFVVAGEKTNIKLTYKEDTYLLVKLFQLRSTNLHSEID